MKVGEFCSHFDISTHTEGFLNDFTEYFDFEKTILSNINIYNNKVIYYSLKFKFLMTHLGVILITEVPCAKNEGHFDTQ